MSLSSPTPLSVGLMQGDMTVATSTWLKPCELFLLCNQNCTEIGRDFFFLIKATCKQYK